MGNKFIFLRSLRNVRGPRWGARALFVSFVVLLLSLSFVPVVLGQGSAGFPTNGAFTVNSYDWLLGWSAPASHWESSSDCQSNGCIHLNNGWARSAPFSTSQNCPLYFYTKVLTGTSSLRAYLYDYNGGATAITYYTITSTSYIVNTVVVPSANAGHALELMVYNTSVVDLFLDDVSSPCTAQAPIFPYSAGTPIPIDFSNYPTQVPFPTAVPYFTQVPYPTMISQMDVVVTNNINANVVISGVVPTGGAIPVRVISDNTPTVVLHNVASPPAIVTRVAVAVPTVSAFRPSSASAMNIGSGSNHNSPVDFTLAQEDLSFTLDLSAIRFPVVTVLIHYTYLTSFTFMHINMLPGITGLAAVYLFVFIIRKLQKR